MDAKNDSYGSGVLISKHTSKPITRTDLRTKDIFWCSICWIKLPTVRSAILHVKGKPHANKALHQQQNTPEQKQDANSIKSSSVGSAVQEPPAKKNKNTEEQKVGDLTCQDCDMKFANASSAIAHFKGKKHVRCIAEKINPKKHESQVQLGGAGRGRGRGWGNVLGNRYGSMTGVNDLFSNILSSNYPYQSSNPPTQPNIYFTGSDGGVPRGAYSSRPLNDPYIDSTGRPHNNNYDRSVPHGTPDGSVRGGYGNYYGDGYANNRPNITTDAAYDSFYRK